MSYFLIYLNGWEKYVTTKCRPICLNNLIPIQQKGRKVPITLQEKVDGEIDQGHIEKLEGYSDKFFVSPIVITVKKDGSVKLALEAREWNKQVHKNKKQIPNMEKLMDAVDQTISEKKSGDIYFSTTDLTYAYGLLPLSILLVYIVIFRSLAEDRPECIDSKPDFMA